MLETLCQHLAAGLQRLNVCLGRADTVEGLLRPECPVLL